MRVTMVCNDGVLPTVDSSSHKGSCRAVKEASRVVLRHDVS